MNDGGNNYEEKKESEDIPLDDVFGHLENLNNLAALLGEDCGFLTS